MKSILLASVLALTSIQAFAFSVPRRDLTIRYMTAVLGDESVRDSFPLGEAVLSIETQISNPSVFMVKSESCTLTVEVKSAPTPFGIGNGMVTLTPAVTAAEGNCNK